MFALMNIDGNLSVNLKCDPEKAIELREQYTFVLPGYHMNKKHWNTILLAGSVPDQLIKTWIDESYELIATSLTKKLKEELVNL